ncbi:family 16 glycosylhydrolase [Flagellimonas allohymeniacidonis]|uniref:family 16 glycosylhydrolase n=1 Tax=Flagellimonas allohymeniacidonis TaxID=2517819 RepID=UPI0013EE672F|nr:family 16 glycosylhydrolase [Allomuricauda hymeniacidonis]
MRKLILLFFCLLVGQAHQAQKETYSSIFNIRYYPDSINKSDSYAAEKCVLDIYHPNNKKNFATIVWFHGGGLESGDKFIPERLKGQGIAIVAVNYRLYPKVKNPKHIEDAAAAIAWVFKNIGDYGGAPNKIFVSGHSAGGYLASMIGLDKKWLSRHNMDANNLAGIVSLSGHTVTHFTIRKENGIPATQPIIDEFAPLYHVRKDSPPILLITGDRELELLGRYEENAYFMRMMKVVGHPKIKLLELDGYGHQMTEPAFPFLLQFMKTNADSTTTKQRMLKLAWSDEFNGPALDTLNWNIREAKPGWVNNELQTYVKTGTIAVEDGKLIITARKVGDTYLSGRINSQGKREFQYGRMEFRAKLPSGNGTWPALWMLGSNIGDVGWPTCGELDIMEHIGRLQNKVHSTVHNKMAHGSHNHTGSLEVDTATEAFHVYAMEWNNEKIDFFVDDTLYYTYQPQEKTKENWPYNQPFFFIINFAIGGNWPGFDIDDKVLPQKLEVDYVRVYQ